MTTPAFPPGTEWYKVEINDLRVDNMKVGIADWERHPDKTQPILVDVALYRAVGVLNAQSIDDCINYVHVISHVTEKWPKRPHTDLLETLLEELVAVCFEDARVDACRVKNPQAACVQRLCRAQRRIFPHAPEISAPK